MAKGVVIFTGSPGVGKTTILARISESGKYGIAGVGDLMLAVGAKKGLVKERDQIRKRLTNGQITELRDAAMDEIAGMDGYVVLDTHASVQENGKYVPGLPLSMMKRIANLAGLFYIDADTDEIIRRMEKDKSRARDLNRMRIDEQRTVNLAALAAHASEFNIPLYIIHNRDNMLEESVREVASKLEDAFKK